MVGVNRILTGVAVPNPVGDPSLTPDQEKILRRKIVDKALEMLQTDYEKSTVVTMVTSLCTVDLLTPKTEAVCLTVAELSMI